MEQDTPKYRPKAEATRRALLASAREVFARDGYANARITDIANSAGKSVGVFYTYFPDKAAIFSALLYDFYLEVKKLVPPAQEYELHTAAAVKTTIHAFWKAYQTFHGELAGLFEVAFTQPTLLETWQKIRHEGMRRFAIRIRKQQELGKCTGINPELMASALLGSLEYACFNWQSRKLDFQGKAVSDSEAVDTMFRIISSTLELDMEPKSS